MHSRTCNDKDDGLVICNASDPESCRPLNPGYRALFESWTAFDWSPLVSLPRWAAPVPLLRVSPQSLEWQRVIKVHQCLLPATLTTPLSPENKTWYASSKDLRHLDGKVDNDIWALEKTASVAFQEIEESKRAAEFKIPESASEVLLLHLLSSGNLTPGVEEVEDGEAVYFSKTLG